MISDAKDNLPDGSEHPVRVLVVDDSSFMRNRLCEIISSCDGLTVAGTAANGLEAVAMAQKIKPDVITMDIEMPLMDGVTAVREIMQKQPTPVLMFSVLTRQGAQASINALEAGATDFLPKQLEEIDGNSGIAKGIIQRRILALGLQARRLRSIRASDDSHRLSRISRDRLYSRDFDVLLIAASTGGPAVIQKLLAALPENFPWPVLVVQHMPENFTGSFAERLDRLSAVHVEEAYNGAQLKPGRVYLAPGGHQLEIDEHYKARGLIVRKSETGDFYKPSADITFRSMAAHFRGKMLALVFTGMGSDGKVGCWFLKKQQATVWAQNEGSCAVYGMPRAVVEAGLADAVCTPQEMIDRLAGVRS